jgi:hypothetical protein
MEYANQGKDRSNHWVLMAFIVIGLLIVSAFIKEFSSYSFISALLLIGFMVYLKIMDKMPAFENINFNNVLMAKLFAESVRSFRKEFNNICLTGEDVIPYKIIAQCVGFFTYSFDTLKTKFISKDDIKKEDKLSDINKLISTSKNKTSSEIWGFWFYIYDSNFFIKGLQGLVPKIPIFNNVLRKIPMIKDLCFPTPKCIITSRDRILFKRDIVEIKGKSLIPLSINPEFNAFSVVEYSGKFDEVRLMEKFIFTKEIHQELFNDISVQCKNAVNIASQLNPQVKVEQETSIMRKS